MTLDLAAITDRVLGLVSDAWPDAPIWAETSTTHPPSPTFTPAFTGLAPDAARKGSGPQLSLYLYHVEHDKAAESLFWQPQIVGAPGGQPTRFMPVALNLFYLLFAYSETSYQQEHAAMSVAMRVLHDNPIVRNKAGAPSAWELTLNLENRSYDELSRLWQATTMPLRTSVVYRASVVLIEGDATPVPATPVQSVTVQGASPAVALAAAEPAILGTSRQTSYVAPTGSTVALNRSPGSVAAGGTIALVGERLGVTGQSDRVYLLSASGGDEVDVSAWVVAGASNASRFTLTLPASGGSPPAGAPDPGIYGVRVGSGTAGATAASRTGAVPLSVAPALDPAAGPVLSGTAPLTVTGHGLGPAGAEVFVGTTPLASTTGTPGSGQVRLAAGGTGFTFTPPGGPSGTVLPLRVRVNGIEAEPSLWVRL